MTPEPYEWIGRPSPEFVDSSQRYEDMMTLLESMTPLRRRATLQINGQPRFLYKYRTIPAEGSLARQNLEGLLLRNELWMANSLHLNDEFEGAARYLIPDGVEERRAGVRALFERVAGARANEYLRRVPEQIYEDPEQLRHMFDTIHPRVQSAVGVCSLAIDPRDKLMWAHYADESKGLCVQLDPSRDVRALTAQAITYTEDFPIIAHALDGDVRDEGIQALLQKSGIWGHEQEWRLFELGRSNVVRTFVPAALTGLILGSRISAEDAEYVTRILEQRRHAFGVAPMLYRVVRSSTGYDYDIRRVQ